MHPGKISLPSTLQYMVAGNHLDFVDTLFDRDRTAAFQTPDNVAIRHLDAESAVLKIALGHRSERMVAKLRSLGGESIVPFQDYIKTSIYSNHSNRD
jgi:hypothetical protein